MLLRVPKGAGGAKINSSAVTAAITGTTVMLETHASTKKNKNSSYKFIVLEGTARLYLPGRLGESTLVKAGQMIIMRPDSKMIPEPVDVDIQKITQSSLLITGFGPLGSETLIAFERTKQNEQKNSGQLIETNLVIYGAGTNVTLIDPNTVDVAVSAESNAGSSPTPARPLQPQGLRRHRRQLQAQRQLSSERQYQLRRRFPTTSLAERQSQPIHLLRPMA